VRSPPLAALLVAVSVAPARADEPPVEADVCVFGGTSGGVVAAVQAARLGKTAVILEPGKHLGGMTSGGLSAVDIGDPRTVGGIAREYFTRLAKKYGKELPWELGRQGIGTGGAFAVEPHAAEELFEAFVREAGKGVRVLREARPVSVKKDGPRLAEVKLDGGRVVRAKVFVDASYEGDLLALAGVTCTVKREANAKYGETLNGVQLFEVPRKEWGEVLPTGRRKDGRGLWDRAVPVDPYVVPGEPESGLLPLVQAGELGAVGDEAPGVQAYCYRLCLTTDPANRLPIAPPAGYDPKRYEVVARYLAACRAAGDDVDLRWFTKHDPLPNRKFDFNTAYLGGNYVGGSLGWPEASYARRAELAREHEDYQRGLLHFLAADPRSPEKVRAELAKFGLCKDEFKDTGGWPHQLYVREARRMVSDLVMTEHHARGKQAAPRPVALASYGIDVHEVRRIAHQGVLVREGKLLGHGGIPGPYPVGYGAIVPRAAECDNLFATFCVSASHVCFASTRMEPVLMMLSQAAATAAGQAIDDGVPVQKVDYDKLRKRLVADGLTLEPPPKKAGK
jgi:hypothetical protein